MSTLLEIELQAEKDNRIDFKVFIVKENAEIYADELKEDLECLENLDLIHEIDKNFNLEELEIFKKDKIVFIISSFEEKWQKNAVREIIKKAKKNKSKILFFTSSYVPLEFKDYMYTFKAKEENQLFRVPKLILRSVYIPSLICNSPEDIYELLIKEYGEIKYYLYENKVNNLDRFKEYIQNSLPNNISSMLIYIEMHPINQVMIADKMLFIAKNLANPQHMVFDIWIDERIREEKIKIHFVTFK